MAFTIWFDGTGHGIAAAFYDFLTWTEDLFVIPSSLHISTGPYGSSMDVHGDEMGV
jgi:hypothetical protein